MNRPANFLKLVTGKPKVSMKAAIPKHLSSDGATWYQQTRDSFQIVDSAGRRTLQIAAEALDEMASARVVLKKEGAFYRDRNGVSRQHPASRQLELARRAYLSAMKALKLKT